MDPLQPADVKWFAVRLEPRFTADLFDGVYAEVDIQLRLAKVRFLSPEVAVAHVQGHSHAKGKVEEKRQEIVITTVLQKRAEGWEIVAFQNTPVQPRPGSSIPPARD